MRVLVIGGTLFLGRHVVEAALGRGHAVTLFHRGVTDGSLYPQAEHVRGDRDGGIGALGDRKFDAVIDTCGYVPRVVDQSAAYLAARSPFYLFVSTISVYAGYQPGDDETAPLAELAEPGSEDIQHHYGPLKVLCERAIDAHFPGRAQHARAGFIVGPYDRIERFPYWVQRLREGGPTLAPGAPDGPFQWIDARDLAAWLVDSAEVARAGVFDLTGPAPPWTIGELLDTVNATLGDRAQLVWPGHEFLASHDVGPFDGLPWWLPPAFQPICQRRLDRALAAGLTFRAVDQTTRDSWAQIERDGFIAGGTVGVDIRRGLTRERERELLAALGFAPAGS